MNVMETNEVEYEQGKGTSNQDRTGNIGLRLYRVAFEEMQREIGALIGSNLRGGRGVCGLGEGYA